MKLKLGIIGHFGKGKMFIDGQTIKTKVLYEELVARGYKNIFCVDTYYRKVNKAKLLWDSLRCILICNTIILLLSENGMRVYLPLMYWSKKLLHRRIFHDVIGGNLASYVKKYPKYKKYLNSFDGNWVEFKKMKNELEELGIDNCTVIPNFKRLKESDAKLDIDDTAKMTFCIFSRIMKEKGITDAIIAVREYNRKHENKIKLEIWGPIDDSYKIEFQDLIEKNKEFIRYNGCVDYNKSVEILTNHIALLFPTHWDGEGFPGTIIDAYTAALPVIASDWNANSELIDNYKTGWVYPNNQIKDLNDSIEWAITYKEEMINMRKNCLNKAAEYNPDRWIDLIDKKLRGVKE